MEYCKFLEHYRRYTEGNETPENIHLWCGITGLSGAVERRVWIEQGFFQVPLNMYIMLLAPAGACAKSTASGLIKNMLKEIGANVFSGAITKRKIVMDMQDSIQNTEHFSDVNKTFTHCSATFIADEFNELISSGGAEIIKFMTTIFSEASLYVDRTATQGTFELPHPCLNIIGNVVPPWFANHLANDMSITGLLARFIIVSAMQKRGLYPETLITSAQKKERKKAIEILFWIFNQHGPIQRSEAAKELFSEWYMAQNIKKSDDDRLLDFVERKYKIHALKVAALMALGDCRMEILPIDIERSIHIIEEEESKLRILYASLGTNKYSQYISRIMNIIDSLGGKLPIRKVHQLLFANLNNDEILNLIKQMESMGMAKYTAINGIPYLVRMQPKKEEE